MGTEGGRHHRSDFNAFEKDGAKLHIDTDVVETLAHLMTADVLVMGRSSFSQIAAILNSNCIVFDAESPWGRDLLGIKKTSDAVFVPDVLSAEGKVGMRTCARRF